MSLIGAEHLEQIKESLGRTPKGQYKVERVGSQNQVLVISVLPIVEQKPFPTTYWLVSPELKKLISHIERDGAISLLEKEIAEDASLKEKLFNDHRSYIKDRHALAHELNEKDHQTYESMNWEKIGIGGIRDWNFIKCLHLHYAHYLARGNTVGELIEKRFSLLKNV